MGENVVTTCTRCGSATGSTNIRPEWDKKYHNGTEWVVSSGAEATYVDHYYSFGENDETALRLKIFYNGNAFRFLIPMSVDTPYDAIQFDFKGDGKTKPVIQLHLSGSISSISLDGCYMTYTPDDASLPGWSTYTYAFNDTHWKINFGGNNYTFDEIPAMYKGYITSAGITKVADLLPYVHSIAILNNKINEGSGPSAYVGVAKIKLVKNASITSGVVHHEIVPGVKLNLDFEDGAGSGAYANSNWKQQKYTSSWVDMSGQMNSRKLNNDDKIVNFALSTTTEMFTYTPDDPIGLVNKVTIDYGHWYSGGSTISYKISLINTAGTKVYLKGDASNWATVTNPTGSLDGMITLTFDDFGIVDVQSIQVTAKCASETAYFYMDDIVLSLVE